MTECLLNTEETENGEKAHIYTLVVPQGYNLGIEIRTIDEKVDCMVVKALIDSTLLQEDGLGDIQKIYAEIVNRMTMDRVDVDELKEVVKTNSVDIDYYRNGNIYGICRTPKNDATTIYYILYSTTEEKAKEFECLDL